MKSKINPKRIFAAAKKNDELELLIYDSIGENWFGGGITPDSVKQQLDAAGEVKKITVRINSPGGNVWDASAIYSLLTQHKADIEVFVDGIAASAAFTIAMAADEGKLHISEAAMMMCHNALGMCMGNASDLRDLAGLLDKISGTMRDIYAKRCDMSADEVQKLMDEETFMTAKEAVEYGFADDVIKRDPQDDEEAQALAASWDLSKISKKAPKAEAKKECQPKEESSPAADAKPAPVADVGGKDEKCMCACAGCKAGHCGACSMNAKPAPVAEVEDKDDKCMCTCAGCKAGDCGACSMKDCTDENCQHDDDSDQEEAKAEQVIALREIESFREALEILSI